MERKKVKSISESTEHLSRSSSARQKAARDFLYEEARGKTVDFVRYADRRDGSPAFEIRFADGTFLFIEPVPQIQFHVRYLKVRAGNVRTIRDYGLVQELIRSSEG